MKTLSDIKEEYARENNFCEWSEILYSIDDPAEIDEHFDKVAKLYAIDACTESLILASENVNVKVAGAGYIVIDKQSILSEDNIPKELL